ncbi:hypothetical protein H0R92_00250 [Treponema sp. OMZ 840]|uniref:hypothetical protein n=1 Tax=Treponema sp. OMZ 840 TaxID=244313 RepID=UPI003D933026
MKPFSLSKLCFIFIFAALLFWACSSPYMNSYYIQQQNKNVQGGGSPEPDWGGGDTPPPPPEQPLEPGTISMFSVILRDGKLAEPNHDTTVYTQLAGKLSASDGFPFALYPTNKFTDWKFSSNFSAANVPEMQYSGTVQWEGSEEEQWYNGSNASAGGNTISSMKYFRYCGKNPFNLYTNDEYDLYGEDGNPTGEKEVLMKRFIFYRFTGNGGGVVSLNNYLVAVDTYSKLVFSFAKPVEFKNVLGNQVPTKWAPVDIVSTGPGGKKYRFYEYDPSGYVTEDGTFHMSAAYKNNLASGNYDPAFTGKSPYLGFVGDVQKPMFKISNIILKNISIKDVGGDYPIAGGTDKAEFRYELKLRHNNGEWDIFSTNNGNHLSIDRGSQADLVGNYALTIEKPEEGTHRIDISCDIWENDPLAGNADDVIIKHEKSLFTLVYDEADNSWSLTGNPVQSYKDDDGEWKVTAVTMPKLESGQKETMTIGISAYIWDWIAVFKRAGWGDMELSFDVEWK